jgi:Ca2+-binding RTX toxin-like protein
MNDGGGQRLWLDRRGDVFQQAFDPPEAASRRGILMVATYIGTTGNDTVTVGYDYLYGADGDDTLGSNVAGLDIVEGGRGNDWIFIYNNADYGNLYGGDGNDLAIGYRLGDNLYGGEGNDLLLGGNFTAPPEGGQPGQAAEVSGNDYFEGGYGVDGIYGFDGTDAIYGGDGNDTNVVITVANASYAGGGTRTYLAGLYGGTGDDYLDGGRGNDYLDGGDDNDTLIGGQGNDKLYGGAGNDLIRADDGTDIAYGGAGNDTIYSGLGNAISAIGEAGNDTIATGNGNDYIDGGADNDTIFSGGGNDTVLGGNGSDALGGYLGNDTFYGDYNVGGLDYFNLSFDVRAGDADYIADFKAGGVQDYIILPTAYSGSVYLTQYGTDVIGYIAQGSSYYSFQVHGYAALTVAEVQAALFFA